MPKTFVHLDSGDPVRVEERWPAQNVGLRNGQLRAKGRKSNNVQGMGDPSFGDSVPNSDMGNASLHHMLSIDIQLKREYSRTLSALLAILACSHDYRFIYDVGKEPGLVITTYLVSIVCLIVLTCCRWMPLTQAVAHVPTRWKT